ncbi:MAG: hypothetical protein H6807_07385 [Planctomycetes bacterium]|nr:hypothetical protein [Planctomycetota bacterium]
MLRGRSLGRFLVLALIGLVFYAPAIDNFWIKDDLAIGNLMDGDAMSWSAWMHELLPFGMTGEHYWRPIPLLPGFLEHALWGLDVRGYHLTNILLQVLCAYLCQCLVDRIGGERNGRAGFLAALLVLLAPTAGESVVWIMQRMVLIASALELAALLFWLRGVERDRPLARVAALFCFVLALLSKEVALTIPGLFFLLDLMRGLPAGTWRQRLRRALLWALPSAVLILLYFLARWLFWGRVVNTYAGLDVLDYARHNRVFELLGATFRNGFLPANPGLLGAGPAAWLRLAMALALTIAGLRLIVVLARNQRHRTSLVLGLGIAVLGLLPILPVVWVDEHLFNARFFHLPAIGLAVLAGIGLRERLPSRTWNVLGAAAATLLVLAYATSLAAQLVAFERASDQILGIRAGLIDQAESRRALGALDPHFVCLQVPDQYLGVPTLEYSLVLAMKPPLTRPEVSVVPLLARDQPRRGFWLADLDRQLAERQLPRDGLVYLECLNDPPGLMPIFAERGATRGTNPPRPIAPADLGFRGNAGAEPEYLFECGDPAARRFRLVFRTPDIAFEFGPELIPGRNCEEVAPGRYRYLSSWADPGQPELPDLWARSVRVPLPRPLAITWRVESLDAEGRLLGVSLDQRLLVFDELGGI